jgi:class 3 adenylate cyclase/tetratricopeptide (TPR) repeat protein
MQCHQCQHENREGANFCEACGSSLTLHCPSCDYTARPGATFCDHCGARLSSTTPTSPETSPITQNDPSATEPSAPEAERRQLTVMFCDLVDSTRLAGLHDPEELREIVRAYQERAAGVIQQYEGHVAQYLGDGLLVYFGWPRAHEDDAHRAVYAGLGIVEVVIDLNKTLEATYGVQLAVRLGIHTGPVVVGEMGGGDRHENLALGETPNIAARLQGVAQPGTVVISDDTRRLVSGAFNYDDLGVPDLKGVSQSSPVFRVRGVSDAASRFEATSKTLTPIVGREVEVDLLMRCWEQALDGEVKVVLLNGPPGIGKSRLLQTLSSRLADTPHVCLRYQCSPYHTNSAFYPIATQVMREMKLPADAASDAKLDRLEALVTQVGLPIEEAVPLFAAMLSIPAADRYPALTLNPQRQKDRTLELFAEGLVSLARQEPVLFCFEDVHWSDPTSLEALGLVIEQVQDARVLVVLTYRPEFEPAWGDHRHVTTYTLSHLSRRQTIALVNNLTGGKALPDEVLDQIVDKTDGIPLFVEELTKTILESEWLMDAGERYEPTSPLPALAIPATLQDSLMARLDRLSEVKDVVQLGATIGREFSFGLLRAVSPLSDPALQDALGQLIDADLISQRGLATESTYSFKHVLILDAAYASMLRSTRQQRHREIAEVLEGQFSEVVGNQPELLAHHYTEAGLHEPAVDYWRQAGQRACEHFANQEAVVNFERALTALAHLPEQHNTLELGCDLRLELRNALLTLGEFDRLHDILREAETLGETLGDPIRLGRIYLALAHHFVRIGNLTDALTIGERGLALTAQSEDDRDHLWLNHVMSQVHYRMGDYRRANERVQHNLELLIGDRIHERMGIAIPSVIGRCLLVRSLADTGRFTEGLARGEEAIHIAAEADHPISLAVAYQAMGYLSICRGDVDNAITFCSQGLDICRRWDIRQTIATLAIYLSQALALAGQIDKALTYLEQTGGLPTVVNSSQHGISFAELYLRAGRLEEAFHFAQRSLELASANQERGLQASALWLLGDIAMHTNPPECQQAGPHYQQALSLANDLGMRPLQAHCHRGLGTLYSQTNWAEQSRTELSTAIEMYRDMEMTFWLPETEAELAKL